MPPKQFLDLRPFKNVFHYQGAYASRTRGTKNFKHLLPLPKHILATFNRHIRAHRWHTKLPKLPPLRLPEARDRIKYWNIVPGDKVRLRKDEEESRIWDVVAINRVLNQVILRDTSSAAQNLLKQRGEIDDEGSRTEGHKSVNYWDCQLYLGEFELPPDEQNYAARKVPVFVKRMRRRTAKFDRFRLEFVWRRVAFATIPPVPGMKMPKWVPWPKPEHKFIPKPTPRDASAEVVMEVTYKPPVFPHTPSGPLPNPPSVKKFQSHILNPHLPRRYSPAAPVEVHLVDELSNPHSRAKKIQRWNVQLIKRKQLLGTLIAKHAKDYGLPQKEARAQAIIEWKARLSDQAHSKKKMRWKKIAERDNLERKVKKKRKKEEVEQRKLRELVLAAGKNQVIPKPTTTVEV